MPRLVNAEGKNITNEFALLGDALERKQLEVEELQVQLDEFRKYYSETHRKHCQKVKEYDQKIQSLREEFEQSKISEIGENGGGKNAIEQAQ